jgi:hypothetical protein
MNSRIFSLQLAALFSIITFLSYSQKEARHQEEADRAKQIDTRIDNNGYWKLKASQGLTRLNGVEPVPQAVYTGSKIKAFSVLTDDSPDVPVAPSSTTQSETSIFVNPNDNSRVLNSNNSTTNPMSILYGADALRSEDSGETWGGTFEGPAGDNYGDPVALIGNNGWQYVGFINVDYGQSIDYSQNGGNSWTRVLVANAGGSILDKNHMWIDNSLNSPYNGQLYNAWTDFGGSFNNEIGLSRSTTGGLSWSTPVNVSSAVNAGSHNQGVNINTGPDGEVYVIWAIYDGWPTDESAIGMARSFDGGATWEPAERIISNIRGIRNSGVNKNMRTNSFPVCAADISGGEYNGNVYVVWCNIGVPGTNSGTDADVYIIRSEDQGETWSVPIRVNQDPSGLGRKHYFPWITCDPETGILSVVFYDDRNVGGNQCEVYCANSYDGGETWEDFKVSDVIFTPTPIAGLAEGYMGDYIAINARGGVVYPCWADTRTGSVMTYVSPYETNPLTRPTDLAAAVTFETGAVDLEWKFDDAPGFSYFKIYRNGDSIATASDTTFQDVLPDYGVYTYRVSAYFESLGESNPASKTLQWGDARISVSPDSIQETVIQDSSLTRYVTVINTGQLQMEYDITPLIQTSRGDGNRDYCTASNGCDEYISRVVLENINNSSSCSGYEDYTDQSAVLMASQEYAITVTNGNPVWAADECGIWIDWNQDEEFTEDEGLIVSGSPGVGPYTATIVPPPTAQPGQTRMRIRVVYAETPEPCGASDYGETEDYSIFLVNWLSIDNYTGNVLPADTAIIAVTLDAGGLELGDYFAELRISSNDPDTPLVVVPVQMNVRDIVVTASAEPQAICLGDSIQLMAQVLGGSGSFTFSWTSLPEGFVSNEPNPRVVPDTTTLYVLEVADEGSIVSDEINVTVHPLPDLNLAGDMAICEGDSVTLDAGADQMTYLWNTGDTTQFITVREAGQYWVEVTNENDCMMSDTMLLSLDALPLVELGRDTTLCYYHQLLLDAGNPGATYLWSTGETSPTILVDSTGMTSGMKTISLEVVSQEGCSSSDTLRINFNECLGFDENAIVASMEVYPNPGKGLFTVILNVKQALQGKIVVINGNGLPVFHEEQVTFAPGNKKELNLQILPDGIYTLQVSTSSGLFRTKIIISR